MSTPVPFFSCSVRADSKKALPAAFEAGDLLIASGIWTVDGALAADAAWARALWEHEPIARVTSGWGDWYYKQLVGQWIDITGVPEGDYTVRVTINRIGIFNEGQNRYPNVVSLPIHVPNPRKKVAVDNSPELIDK